MRLCALVLALVVLGLLPGSAAAHSIVRVNNGVVSYISSDAISLNTLEISNQGADVRLYDPSVDGGIDQGTSCRPGETTTDGFVIEVFCPRAGVNQVRVEIGEREDTMTVAAGFNVPILAIAGNGRDRMFSGPLNDILVGNEGSDEIDGGAGNDQVNGSEGDDTVRGGPGDDTLQAGPGADDVDGGTGKDDIRVRDGARDRVVCGGDADKVDADTIDDVAADCESVVRAAAPPSTSGDGGPAGGGSPGSTPGTPNGGGGDGDGGPGARDDKSAPDLRVGGSTSQRLRSSRKLTVLTTSSERGTVAASGFLDVAGIRLPLKSKPSAVQTAGGGAKITVKLTRGQYRRALRALRKRRRVSVLLDIVATDAAGNSTAAKAPRIRLRR